MAFRKERQYSNTCGEHVMMRCCRVGSIDVAFDNMAGPVIVRVESGRPATSTAASFPVTDLIGWFGDHHDDAAVAQVTADRAGGIRLVAANPFRPVPGPARTCTLNPQLAAQVVEHG